MKQGCVLAPTIFTLFIRMMLQQVTEDLDDKDGVCIRFLYRWQLVQSETIANPHKDQGEANQEATVELSRPCSEQHHAL